ncbi:MAG: DUF3857 domain-containing protein [Bacteroides sp.]|nr:DUF3857 domain-containing protein [Bacteroides sp.]
MKRVSLSRLLAAVCCAFTCLTTGLAQESVLSPSLKYGKPSKEELALEHYAPDTTATALCLVREGNIYFTYNDGFRLVTETWVRLKILKPQGVSHGTVSIPYYAPADPTKSQDVVQDLEGTAYNMEQGKLVKTRLKKEYVGDERVNPSYRVMKFSLPGVKEGTVIEYRYKVLSDYVVHVENWTMQEDIPVIYNRCKFEVPAVYVYNFEFRGGNRIQVEQGHGVMQCSSTLSSGVSKIDKGFQVNTQEYTFTSQNLPAIRQNEPYCYCPEDHRIQITFDLQATNFPQEGYKPYSKDWGDVDRVLLQTERGDFGRHLAMSDPFLEDTKRMGSGLTDFDQKVATAFTLLKSKLVWDGNYRLECDDMEKVLREGKGSNAALNFVFMSILRSFAIPSYPVVMSRRSLGILPTFFPSFQKLNTFVVAIYHPETKKYLFLDSSMDYPLYGLLPAELSVDKARILSPDLPEKEKWVNLQQLSNNQTMINFTADITPERINGHVRNTRYGQQAMHHKTAINKADTLQAIAANYPEGIMISHLQLNESTSGRLTLTEEMDFRLPIEANGDYLYLNPMLFPQLKENPFTQSDRMLPVEFAHPYKCYIIGRLTLPEGYVVEELPPSQAVKTSDGKLQYKYILKQEGNILRLAYTFEVNASSYAAGQYAQLHDIWSKAVEHNQSVIALKKTP